MNFPSPARFVPVTRRDLAISMLIDGRKEGSPLVVRPKDSPETTFDILPGPENGHFIVGWTSKWHVGANPDNLQEQPYPFVTETPFDWSIQPAGQGTFKIHFPNKDECVKLPENAKDGSELSIGPANGTMEELWQVVPGHEY
ncbi:hypothetical protein FRC12_020526 [Ceratobasidium sp. 428]|nr:hypothetical protein FRC12_001313 [Ceratobasidium sp. 428]KAG8794889.1 hypothetical protein FRC12_020526 [Ceratobasidium sp. 428]